MDVADCQIVWIQATCENFIVCSKQLRQVSVPPNSKIPLFDILNNNKITYSTNKQWWVYDTEFIARFCVVTLNKWADIRLQDLGSRPGPDMRSHRVSTFDCYAKR